MMPDPNLSLTDPGLGYAGYANPGIPLTTPTANPAALPTAGIYASMGLSAIGAITTAIGVARATKAQGYYESNIANTNAAIAEVQAKQSLEAGDVAASRKNIQTQQEIGSERAAQGASGVDVASGSSALVRNATQGVGAIDELTIKNNAARQAWGYQTQAIQDTYQGKFAQLTANASSEQSLLNGGLQAISGPLSIKSNYLRWSRSMGGRSGSNPSGVPFPNMS